MNESIIISKTYNISLTPLRKKILNLFINNRYPLKAYDIIKNINNERETKPIVIYRILNLFLEKNIIHKIESKNSFILCDNNFCYHADKVIIFLLCNHCNKVIELTNAKLLNSIENLCRDKFFKLIAGNIELNGHCFDCDK